jgi:hypothetical protein
MGLHGLLGDSFTFFYVDDIRTSQEIYLWACTAYYGDSFTFLTLEQTTDHDNAYHLSSDHTINTVTPTVML